MEVHPLYHIYRLWSGCTFRARRKVSPAGALALGFLVVVGALAWDTDFSLAYQIWPVLGGLLLAALGWSFLPRFRQPWRAVRFLPRYATVGARLRYHLELNPPSSGPGGEMVLWEDLPDPRPTLRQFLSVKEPGEDRRNWFDRWFGFYRWTWLIEHNRRARLRPGPVPLLKSGQACRLPRELVPRRRGLLVFESLTLGWNEPFGLFRSLRRVPCRQALVVLPKRYVLPPVSLPGRRQYQPGGVAMAMSVGQSDEFVGLRDYRAGDPLRHIHWRSSARKGVPIVKEFQDEYMVRHALILDTFREGGAEDVLEEAVSLAASFACTIPEEDSLLDLLLVENRAYCFTSGRGLGHPEQMLEILATVQPSPPESFSMLEELVMRHARQLSGSVLILTQWNEARRRLWLQLRAAGVSVEIFLILPAAANAQRAPDLPASARLLLAGKIQEQLNGL